MPAPTPPTQQAKVCIVCGKDCSSIDRIKDEQGRYTCKPCADAKAGKAPSKGKGSDKDLAALYERPQTKQCPQCDKPVPHDAEICVACGYNMRAGKKVKTKLGKLDPLAGVNAEEMAAKRQNKKRWWIAGLIGGVIGAGIWVGLAYQFTDPAAWGAIIVGLLVGGSVWLAAREFAAVKTLVVALVLFVIFGAIGKGGSAALLTAVNGPQRPTDVVVTVDSAKGYWAREVAKEMVGAGKQLYWPGNYTVETATFSDHFPPDVWAEATNRWDAGGESWQTQYRTAKAGELQAQADEKFTEERQAAFLAKFDWMDAVYGGIGLVLALALGAGVLNMLPQKN
jgi:hypothetical protein